MVHIPAKLNTTTDKLNRLEMSRYYYTPQRTFQFIQETLRCYPKVDLFASRKNHLLRKYALVIPSKDPNNLRNTLRIEWQKTFFNSDISTDSIGSKKYSNVCQQRIESNIDGPKN
jgi:NAD-specific glutamate dehydrogenase